jgi:hypothetical protein
MKKSLLLLLFVLVTTIVSSQVITVKLDTCQFFEHSSSMSTPQAIESGNLVYKKRYENKPNFEVKFDLGKSIETYKDYDFDIIQINQSTNIIDVVVKENDLTSLIVLGETEEGNIMYIYEYREGDLIKGFFSKNPKFVIENKIL